MQGWRTQQVVDLTNPDACHAYVYGAMNKLVGELGIDYIHQMGSQQARHCSRYSDARRCMSRRLPSIDSPIWKAAHPLEIESCSSPAVQAVDLGTLGGDRIWGLTVSIW